MQSTNGIFDRSVEMKNGILDLLLSLLLSTSVFAGVENGRSGDTVTAEVAADSEQVRISADSIVR